MLVSHRPHNPSLSFKTLSPLPTTRFAQIKIGLFETLNALKDKISNCSTITTSTGGGSILPDHQRLFHLGRELKTGKRSLSKLGIGKHDVFLVHLFSNQPATLELSSDDDDEGDDVVVVTSIRNITRGGKKRSHTVNGCGVEEVKGGNDGSDGCNEDSEVVEVNSWEEAKIKQGQDGHGSTVVDLLESDDDDVIEVQPSDTDNTFKRSRIS